MKKKFFKKDDSEIETILEEKTNEPGSPIEDPELDDEFECIDCEKRFEKQSECENHKCENDKSDKLDNVPGPEAERPRHQAYVRLNPYNQDVKEVGVEDSREEGEENPKSPRVENPKSPRVENPKSLVQPKKLKRRKKKSQPKNLTLTLDSIYD